MRRLPFGRLATVAVGVLARGGVWVPAPVVAQEFHVDREAERTVVFVSRTALDTFRGVSDAVDGYVLLDGGGVRPLTGPLGRLYFEVDLATLDTGIELRNRHMRENYLEVADHPYATFDGRVTAIRPDSGAAFRADAAGTFAAHGIERTRDLTCDVVPDGDGFVVSCTFPVLLSDHDIEIPRLMFMRLAEEVQIELRFRLRRVGSPDPLPHAREAS